MKHINFREFVIYFKNELEAIKNTLFEEGEISNEFNFTIYQNFAELETKYNDVSYIQDIYSSGENDTNKIINIDVVIADGGTVSDITSPLNLYLQTVNFDFIVDKEYSTDFYKIIKEFVTTHTNVPVEGFSMDAVVNAQGNFTENYLNVQGHQKIELIFDVDLTLFSNGMFSNGITLNVNGTNIPVNSIMIDSSSEITPDLKKENDQRFFQNTTIQTVTFNGVCLRDNTVVKDIIKDICKSSRFNQLWEINVVDTNDFEIDEDGNKIYEVLLSDNFMRSRGILKINFGSVMSYEISFVKGVIL